MNDEEHDNECEWASEACGCDSRKELRAENAALRDQRDRLITLVREAAEPSATQDKANIGMVAQWDVDALAILAEIEGEVK